jgi:NSS family neurotransmitter:Na+ symporter
LFTGLAVFGTLGFMAAQKGLPISEVATGGPGLAFVVYPEAINNLPFANAWFGVAFFTALVLAGLSSGISMIEAFACSITDKFNITREKVVTIICTFGFIISSVYTTNAGIYILDIVDHFITNYALVLGGLLECIFVGWIVKAEVLRKYVNHLGMKQLVKLWDYCVKYVTPAILLIILSSTIYSDWFSDGKSPYQDVLSISIGVGVILFNTVLAVLFSIYKWKDSKPKHKPEEDHLLV